VLVAERATRHHGPNVHLGTMTPKLAVAGAFLTVALSLGVTCTHVRPAMAQAEASSSGLKMAQDLVDEGRALGQQGKWADALERFQKAASLSRKTTPQLAFYVGYAEARVGKLVAADVDLRRAIELARESRNEQVAKAAQAELPEVEARTPALTITVNGQATPVGLQVDGGPMSVAALGSAVPLDPGDHTIVVRFAAGAVTRPVTLVERQRASLAIDPPAAGAVPPAPIGNPSPVVVPPPPPPPAPPAPSEGSGRKILGLAVAGAGGAALVTGGVFYLLARSALSPVTTACPSSPCNATNESQLQSDYHDAQNKQTISIVLVVAGGAVAVTGLVLFLTGGSSAAAAPASSAQIVPWVGVGSAGLSGSF
jgi:hypothetical protein